MYGSFVDGKANNQVSDVVPSWDGAPRGWRRYVKEVQWFVLGTKPSLRRYLASRLITKLSGSARLLAMTWKLADFNGPNGVRILLQKLAQSPLVRKSLPNAASIMGQYFAFKRHRGEQISSFLIRECLVFLKEEQTGMGPEQNGFGIPDEVDEDDEAQEQASEADETGSRPAPKPKSRPAGYARIPQDTEAEETILSMSDSFILEQLRGWRLLTSASLTSEEWRDVLGTTQGKLDYQSISDALQVLYDEQMVPAARHFGTSQPSVNINLHEQDWDDADWSSWSPTLDDWYDDGPWHHSLEDEDWWWHQGEDESETMDNEFTPEADPSGSTSETTADHLFQEQRTWSQAHKASAVMKKDRGFGKMSCFICGSTNHLAKECPDRHAPGKGKGYSNGKGHSFFPKGSEYGPGKGRGKSFHYFDMNDPYLNFLKGKQKSFKGKGKSFDKQGKDKSRSVNAYLHNYYGLQMDINSQQALQPPHGQPSQALGPESGMVDSGATCSAGPETSVQRLITTIMDKDSGAQILVQTKDPPRFRYGSGKWGQALYKVTITSSLSGKPRSFSCFALPDPEEIHEKWFTPQMLVPVLIGMDWLGAQGVGKTFYCFICHRPVQVDCFMSSVSAAAHCSYKWGRAHPEAIRLLFHLLDPAMAPKEKKAETKKDHSRQVEADPRDPRCNPQMWPCFGNHQANKEMSNRWGAWRNCARCGLRMIYVPKEGSPANSVQNVNPANMMKALKQLQELMDPDMEPTEEIVRAMLEKVIAEERMSVLLKEYQRTWEKNKEKVRQAEDLIKRPSCDLKKHNHQGYSSTSASPSTPNSWTQVPDLKKETLEHALTMLTEEEKNQIFNLARDRSSKSNPTPIPLSDTELEPDYGAQ